MIRVLCCLVLLVVPIMGCPGSNSDPPAADSRTGEETVRHDAAWDLHSGDQLPGIDGPTTDGPTTDGPTTDGAPANPCLAKTPSGIALNPGCDPDYQINGPTTVGQFLEITSGKPAWLYTCGKKFWTFDPAALGGKGAFTTGGSDLALAVKSLLPDCTAKSSDGTPLNPGCDLLFQANGPTTLGNVKDATSQQIGWLLTSGTKFWIFNPLAQGGKGAFVAAGADISKATTPISPGCTSKAPDGTPLNPGCDISYQANGPTAWGEFTNASTGKTAWLFVTKTKYWLFDPTAAGGQGAFTAAGNDLSKTLIAMQPGCSAKAKDGTLLNPGCEASFQANGPTAIGALAGSTAGTSFWLFTAGKKYWLFDPKAAGGKGAFTAAGGDIASITRLLSP